MSISITGGTWVVLWSPHQRCFHVETLEDMLETNRRTFVEQRPGDYILLGFANSHQEAVADSKKIERFRFEPEEPEAKTP